MWNTRALSRWVIGSAIAVVLSLNAIQTQAVTFFLDGSPTASLTLTQQLADNSTLQRGPFTLNTFSGALSGGIASAGADSDIGFSGVTAFPNFALVQLTSGSAVLQSRDGGNFAANAPATTVVNINAQYTTNQALPSTLFGYFNTLANLVVNNPADTASINANFTFSLDKANTGPGADVTVPVTAALSTTGTSVYNQSVFGFSQVTNATAPAVTGTPHRLTINGTVIMTALEVPPGPGGITTSAPGGDGPRVNGRRVPRAGRPGRRDRLDGNARPVRHVLRHVRHATGRVEADGVRLIHRGHQRQHDVQLRPVDRG